MAQPAPAPGTKGPLGEPRNPSTEGILSLVTCGLYAYYWIYMRGEELKNHNGDGMGGVVLLLLTLVIVGPFLLAAEVQKTYESDGRQSPVTALTALWLLLPLVGIFVFVSKTQTALNDYWVSKGAQPVA